MNLPPQQTSESIRALVNYAVCELHIPIGSNSKGFFLCSSAAETEAVALSFVRRAYGMIGHAEALVEAWNVRNDSQATTPRFP